MNKNLPQHHSRLESFKLENFKQKNIFFQKNEYQWSKCCPLIVAETWKHYYYIALYNDENEECFDTEEIYCMEKWAMKKFVDIKSARRLKTLNITESLIKTLGAIDQLPNGLDSAWLFGSMLPEYLPYCSVLEVYYNEQDRCLLPDLVFCHPEIWDEYKSNKSNLEKNEIVRLEKKFEFHLENSIKDPLNSVLVRLGTDLKAILFYLNNLKAEINKKK